MARKKGWFPVSENKNTETLSEDLSLLLDSAYTLLEEARSSAFFALLEPYYQRAREIPIAALVAMHKTGAEFGRLGRAVDLLASMTGPTGPMPNRSCHFDMLELQFVFRCIAKLDVALVVDAINAPGGRS